MSRRSRREIPREKFTRMIEIYWNLVIPHHRIDDNTLSLILKLSDQVFVGVLSEPNAFGRIHKGVVCIKLYLREKRRIDSYDIICWREIYP
ncbi:hypothetical protein AR158_c049L [Paramecium bursaria Chlorella virus AR158]|uniref:hypothetical protein n=1 Tax=Paramecium bursaria Chlorella virus AR158 TaxID=380598 RepID=UPI00015AA74F|nr:hypothetical protein AR158_c049L [Paramecium bursaria Chlorella virus AR158]ABU43595.1 hypothetical protein AR158_c049L [Paramecium bursaria Chlorella virus AR158]